MQGGLQPVVVQRPHTLQEAGVDQTAFADPGKGSAGKAGLQGGQSLPAVVHLFLQIKIGSSICGIHKKYLLQRQLEFLILLIARQGKTKLPDMSGQLLQPGIHACTADGNFSFSNLPILMYYQLHGTSSQLR